MKVGILGAGQLAQLLTHAAYTLGIETLLITETKAQNILKCAHDCDVMTLENENVDTGLLEELQKKIPVYPGVQAIRIAQDRLFEKTLFKDLGIPTTAFSEVNSLADLQAAIQKMGLPVILKTRRFGYDGKGQVVIRNRDSAAAAWEEIGQVPSILESFVDFDFEVSLIAARNASQEVIFYPLIKNTHREGILRLSESPYLNDHLQTLAQEYTLGLLNTLNYVGTLAFEFFVKNNRLIANEIAPRVHNSGHLTIEGFNASQFENHLRAVLHLPLIKPVLRTPTLMYNIIGTFPTLTAQDYQHIHLYNYRKSERPGRKLGHIIFLEPDDALLQRLETED